MACFPRIIRQKDGYNPSSGKIHFMDTTTARSQVGRYIRHEEVSLAYKNDDTPERSTPNHVETPNSKTNTVVNSIHQKHSRSSCKPLNNSVSENVSEYAAHQITPDVSLSCQTFGNREGGEIQIKPIPSTHNKHANTNESPSTSTFKLGTAYSKPPQTPTNLEQLKQKQQNELFLPMNKDSGPEPNKVVIFAGEKQSSTPESHGNGRKSSGFAVKLTAAAAAAEAETPPEAQGKVHTYPSDPYVAEETTLLLHPQVPPAAVPLTTKASPSSHVGVKNSDVDSNSIQTTMNQQKNNNPAKTNTRQDNEWENQTDYSLENKNHTTEVGRDSGVQIEDAFEAKCISMETLSRVEGGVMFDRPKLSTKKPINIEVFRKDESTRNLIRTAIERNDFLNNYMDKDRKEMVIDAMQASYYDEGCFIIRENEEGSEIFVSEEGYYDVIKSGNIIGTIGPGTVFGELAILYSAKRFASIKTATKAKVWKIDRVKFRNIMLVSGYKEKEEYLQFLKSSPILKDLSNEVLVKLVDLLKRRFYPGNTCIVREGEVGNEFFIIRGGTVTIKKFQSDGTERIVAHRKRGDYFGEHAILNADVRQASVYADPPVTECLKLDRETVISYLGTIPQLRENLENKVIERRSTGRKSEFNQEYEGIELRDLKKVATLGAGAFGRVDLVLQTSTSKTFALKILRKIDVIKQDQIEHVYSEKKVMMMCRGCPFIIELYKTFRNEKFVYFLMEACLGGDVWTIMSKRKYFDEKTARFIAGCVVEAFEFLHSRNIIYRDLKPENLMLTTDGYCKLVDFGFAKRILENHKTNTFAGTPEYVAPEIILDRGHDKSVDYWALGILVFELLVGKSPFRGQNQIKIYQQILGGIDVIQMPSRIPKTAQGLIKQLCKQMPAERLGYQRKGILDIKRHSWFDGFDWKRLKAKTLPSPIKRPISSNVDLQYFEPCSGDTDEPPDETSGWDVDF